MAKLYIDCSETYYSQLNTGIQRVVRNIVSKKAFFENDGFESACSVVFLGGDFYRLEMDEKLPLDLKKKFFFISLKLRHLLDFIFKTLKLDSSQRKVYLSDGKIKINGGGEHTLHVAIVLYCRKILKNLYSVFDLVEALFLIKKKIHFSDHDTLFLADSFWAPNSGIVSAVPKIKKNGTNIVVLLYDIISITHESFMGLGIAFNFQRRFSELVKLVDGFIFISQFTQSETIFHLENNQSNFAGTPSEYFYLGCDIEKPLLCEEVVSKNNDEKIYLMVGTIEPRKNHIYAIEAFHKYRDLGGNGKLIIVGRIGWGYEETLEVIHASPHYNKCLFLYNNVTDSELVELYSTCSALIFSSIVEGFGLPLVEAMNYDRLVFASDIPVFREIGGDYPFYFDLNSPDSLVRLLHLFEAGELDYKKEKPILLSWDDSVSQLSSKLLKLQEKMNIVPNDEWSHDD